MSCESESGLALLARLGSRPDMGHLQPQLLPGLQSGEVVEVTGDAGSGKSILCFQLLSSALLPQTWNGIKFGGSETQIVFIDSDMTFNILIIENMLTRRVKKLLKNCQEVLKKKRKSIVTDDDLIIFSDINEAEKLFRTDKENLKKQIKDLVKNCLSNLFYFRCRDSSQFAMTLISVDQLLISKPNISIVFIDSISSFYWYDKTYKADNWYKLEQYYNKIFKVFLPLIKENKIVLVATRQSLFKKNDNKRIQYGETEEMEDECAYEYMGKEWASSVDRKINLTTLKRKTDSVDFKEFIPIYIAEVDNKKENFQLEFDVHEEGLQFKK